MAKSIKALITPEVLKWARERRIRLDLDFAAEKLKIDSECLVAWENGNDQPTFTQLKKIAKFYRTHVSIFYMPKPPNNFPILTDNRELPTSEKPDEKQTYRLHANIIEAYERRERLIELFRLLKQDPPYVTFNFDWHIDPKLAAVIVGEFLEFDRKHLQQEKDKYSALKYWKRLVEAKSILVCHTSVNTHLSVDLKTMRGFCISDNPFPIIVINPKDNPYSRIFTIIHELSHIAMGRSVIQNTHFEDTNTIRSRRIESFCNEVAAEVLLPSEELLEMVKLRTLKEDYLNCPNTSM